MVHEFLDRAHAEMPDARPGRGGIFLPLRLRLCSAACARLVKITSEATHKDFSDQGKLLHDKARSCGTVPVACVVSRFCEDFLRSNCRVATAEPVVALIGSVFVFSGSAKREERGRRDGDIPVKVRSKTTGPQPRCGLKSCFVPSPHPKTKAKEEG